MADAAAAELDVNVSADDLDTFLRDYVEVYVLRHAGSTRGQLLGLVEESEDPAAAVTERLDEWEEDRAETETGRELVRSANAFTKAAWALVGVTVISWRAVGKSCPYCDELDGRTVEITRSFLENGESVADLTVSTRVGHPPVHKGCLPGHANVLSRSGITASSQRRYDGDLVVIRTASGKELSCTPNHPILTYLGWVAAEALDVGDNVVGSRAADWNVTPVGDGQDAPAMIHEVAETLGGASEVVTVEVVGAAEDFHGDGTDGEVTVVRTHRHLLPVLDATFIEKGGEHPLRVGDADLVGLSGLGSATEGVEAVGPATLRAVRGGGLGLSLGGGHRGGAHSAGLAPVSDRNPGLAQAAINNWPTYAEVASEGENGPAGEVFLDEVISVERVAFHGDVFNLETEAGYYVAEGIVTHNCDCILMPETGSRAALSSAEIRTVLRDIADGAGAWLDDCGSGCTHDHPDRISDRDAYIRGNYERLRDAHGRGVALSMLKETILSRAADGWAPIGERQILRIAKRHRD
jgi:hypothetical protein